ncbi:E3 ubiquitin-protein ligase [Martiniozyma asiatica (nom. inval.)]|nr:E3 ubiquitin-protein ligase [Martiniozyma asiatica]
MFPTQFDNYHLVSYIGASTAIGIGLLLKLNENSQNLYVLSYKLSSGFPLIIMCNLFVALFSGIGKFLQVIVFGELRLIEIEHIQERLWPAIISMVMSGTVYSKRQHPLFLVTTVLLLIVTKVLHWLAIDRLDMLIQKYQQSTNTRLRNLILNKAFFTALILLKLDYSIVTGFIDSSLDDKKSIMLVLAFEFFLIGSNLLKAFVKFLISVSELVYLDRYPEEDMWDLKPWLIAISDLLLALVSVVMVPTVFIFFVTLGVMPVNLAGDMFFATLSFVKSISAIFRIYKSHKKLNDALTNPSIEELEGNDLCIVCRDDMGIESSSPNAVPKKLYCGHILHFGCLKSWLERSDLCPVCRKKVFEKDNTAIEEAPVGQNANILNAIQPQLQPQPHVYEIPLQTDTPVYVDNRHKNVEQLTRDLELEVVETQRLIEKLDRQRMTMMKKKAELDNFLNPNEAEDIIAYEDTEINVDREYENESFLKTIKPSLVSKELQKRYETFKENFLRSQQNRPLVPIVEIDEMEDTDQGDDAVSFLIEEDGTFKWNENTHIYLDHDS